MDDRVLLQLAQAATAEERAALLALALLENQPEAVRRAAVAAAVPHWFDAAVLAALVNPKLSDTSEVSDSYVRNVPCQYTLLMFDHLS